MVEVHLDEGEGTPTWYLATASRTVAGWVEVMLTVTKETIWVPCVAVRSVKTVSSSFEPADEEECELWYEHTDGAAGWWPVTVLSTKRPDPGERYRVQYEIEGFSKVHRVQRESLRPMDFSCDRPIGDESLLTSERKPKKKIKVGGLGEGAKRSYLYLDYVEWRRRYKRPAETHWAETGPGFR